MKKVLIIGGGFAGVQTAIELQKSKQFEVTLVSDRNFLFVYPISIWVPVRSKNFDDVKIPLAKIQNKFGFNLVWSSGHTVVVEASTNLVNWEPVQTNMLTTGSAYFSDPQWTNYPGRFYRLRSP